MARRKKILKDFSKPYQIVDTTNIDVFKLMPEYEDIPKEFNMYNGTSIFCKLQTKWFFNGLENFEFPPTKEEINREDAIQHLTSIQYSWAPKHQHKCAAVAYLMSLWFKEPENTDIKIFL